jgi:hypothetical protein
MGRKTHLAAHLLLTTLLALALAGCPAGDDDDTSGDDDATGDDDTTDNESCGPLLGSWNLTQFECGDYDITADWFDVMNSTVLDVSGGADSCVIVLTNTGDTCVEAQEFHYVVGADTLSGESQGITSCTPDACTFTADDEPCVVDDGAGDTTGEGDFSVDGDTLTVTNVEPEGLCGQLTMVQTWARM